MSKKYSSMAKGGSMNQITSPIKAIRAYCLDCSNGQYSVVRKCPCKKCPLFAFRFGKNPFHTLAKNGQHSQQTGAYAQLVSTSGERGKIMPKDMERHAEELRETD
jgi:hypothetical protein